LGLGSNLGPSEETLRFAAENLSQHLLDSRLSSPFSTRALCDPDQPRFLNAVLVGSSLLDPEELLGLAKGIEWYAGRRPGPRYGPRPLDIDLLVFGDRTLARPELTLPHPLIRRRGFVLFPLAEVAPDLPIPPDGIKVATLLTDLADDQDVVQAAWGSVQP
jgi:2-amino-4-hydroxy-6-hydroxymethyldihydropteridine diphosphokinase